MRKTLLAILLALALVLIPVGNAFAASSVDVYVYATPMILSLTVTPTNWYINSLGPLAGTYGDNITRPNTLYYSNPLGDNVSPSDPVVNAETHFMFENNSGVAIDISCRMTDFINGDLMQNGEGGYTINSANVFGASGYALGDSWPADAIIFSYSDNVLVTDLADSDNITWGVALLTQQDAFTVAGTMTSTITCTAAEHM
jgi:hypothetical protein